MRNGRVPHFVIGSYSPDTHSPDPSDLQKNANAQLRRAFKLSRLFCASCPAPVLGCISAIF